MDELVSICICTYNRKKLLKRSIESVLGQSYKSIEVIVVDDNSSDGTKELVESYVESESQIVYIRNVENKGLAYNRNVGIQKASGKYFSFIDDDDYWDSDFIQDFVETCSGYSDNTIFCGGHRQTFKDAIVEYYFDIDLTLEEAMKSGYTPPVASQFYFTSTLRKIGGYNTNVKSGVDHDLWIRLLKEHVRLVSSANGYAYLNDDMSGGNRMTTNYKGRYAKIHRSLKIWEININDTDTGFFKHFVKSYKFYMNFKFTIVNVNNRAFRDAFKLFVKCPFKLFFIKKVLLKVYNVGMMWVKYSVLREKHIRIRIDNTFPKY